MTKSKIIIGVLSVIIVILLMNTCEKQSTCESKIFNLNAEVSQLILDNQKLDENIKNLEAEIEELKFGKTVLFSELEELIALKEYVKAKEKILLLQEKHPGSIETTKALKMLNSVEEELLWQDINSKRYLSLIDKYSDKYPKGKYTNSVKNIKREIITENEKTAYQKAKDINSSMGWLSFLNEYPNHADRENIKDKIITLEVDEIMGKSNTGSLPTFSRTNYGNSSSSSVTIKNDTGYDLTIRYSGPSVIKINIPRGGSRTTNLLSGSYKIAASAGGLNYGGSENISGNYSSSYYIRTSRY